MPIDPDLQRHQDPELHGVPRLRCCAGRLDLPPGHRVLEIGTGTGYNAALLCRRVGDRNVVSVDIDAELVGAARIRLAELGHHPTVVTAGHARGACWLWDTMEAATRTWDLLGHPGRTRYGLTALDDVHRQYIWLDDPAGDHSWPLL